MEAKDLMIGDFVHYKMDLGNDGIYEKDIEVLNIYGSEVNCDVRDWEIVSGNRISNCHPIPLTEEILEANNIKYQYGMPWYQGGYDETGIEVHFSNDCQLKLRYVHELQHALRICGIDKEIKL